MTWDHKLNAYKNMNKVKSKVDVTYVNTTKT